MEDKVGKPLVKNRPLAVVFLMLFGVSASGAAIPPQKQTATPLIRKSSRVDVSRYSGSARSSRITQADFRQLAYELQDAKNTGAAEKRSVLQTQPYEKIRTPRNNLRSSVPLSLIHWSRTLSAVTPEQKRAALAAGLTPVPAETNLPVFAFSPLRPTTYRGANITLSLASGDLFEEAVAPEKAIQTLRIDPGDGGGWRQLEAGQEAAAAYTSTGTKAMALEATLADGTVLVASASLEVASLSTPDPTTSITLTAAAPYSSVKGTLYVYTSGNHAGLRCPVLVAEGFDMENNMDWDVLYNTLNEEQLAETVRAYGRDLLVLDYADAMRSISENAALARAAINYVNAERSNPDDAFTVIGASMGGLVTRMALADMDRAPASYGTSDVNTWISFDSPQTGANIPLGIQEFLKFFSDKNDAFASAADLYGILNQPAAKQMLLVHHAVTGELAGNAEHDAFQATMDRGGYPMSCKKIAISNGSGHGVQQPYRAGERVLHWSCRSFAVDIDADIYALSTASTPTVPTVFYGFWDTVAPLDETSTRQQHYYHDALDNAPGGTRDSFHVLFDSIPSGYRDDSDYCRAPDHCFIPTVSSLGISTTYCNLPLHTNESLQALSPFDEIHYPSSNEAHITINANNKLWFLKAILEGFDTDGDGSDDYQEFLAGTPYNNTVPPPAITEPFVCPPTSDLPLTSAGSYDGFFYRANAFDDGSATAVRGTLKLKLTGVAGKLTAKVVTQKATLSFSAAAWTATEADGTFRTTLKARSGEMLTLDVRQNRVWGLLTGNTPAGEPLALDGARNRFEDSKDSAAQALLTGFKGYYTVALPVAEALSLGSADAAPLGSGYLAVTIGSGGSAKIAGVLADGTKVSQASRLILFDGCGPEACVPVFLPLYTKQGWAGGLLWISPGHGAVATDRDLGWYVRWERPGAGPDGFSVLLDADGGYYGTSAALAGSYLFSADAGVGNVPFYTGTGFADAAGAALPVGIAVAGSKLTMVKGVKPVLVESAYDYAGGNSSLATLTFTSGTGLFKGTFNLYYDYVVNGRLTHKAVRVPYAGVRTPVRSETFAARPAGQGHCLVPDNAPAVKAYKLKRSFPVRLEAVP